MKILVTGLVAALGVASVALADGPSGHVYDISIPSAELNYTTTFHADGRMENSMGQEGTWTYEDGELCLGSAEEPTCNAFDMMDVGDSVTTTDWSPDGTEMTITRVE